MQGSTVSSASYYRGEIGVAQLSRIRKSLAGIFLSLTALSLPGCTDKPSSRPAHATSYRAIPVAFDLGDPSRFRFEIFNLASGSGNRLLVGYCKYDTVARELLGPFVKVSTDGGETFGPERRLPVPRGSPLEEFLAEFSYADSRLAALYGVRSASGNGLYYTFTQDDGVTWAEPVQVNDEQGSVAVGGGARFSFLQPTREKVCCLWNDSRRGFVLTYFAVSLDGGRTWSPNRPVDYDFREGGQLGATLLTGAQGRLIALWTDNRDRETLYDVRASYSDDEGLHWSKSQKINDDQGRVWQMLNSAVARGNEISVVFTDFRETGADGDNDWNVYFARSSDNGVTWSANTRVNDVQEGVDDYAILLTRPDGTLFCFWRSCRNSILGELYLSYSTDRGRSWSQSSRVDDGDALLYREGEQLILSSDNRLLCRWYERSPAGREVRVAWLESYTPQQHDLMPAQTARVDHPPAPPATAGARLFSDDFSDGSTARWRSLAGVWTVVDGSLMGVYPGSTLPFATFAQFREPEAYLMKGKFKLDPLHHQVATIYLRGQPASGRYYAVANAFRIGVCLSVRDTALPALWIPGGLVIDGRPLRQRRFAFQNDRWYEFALAVYPDRVDYFVDGHWLLSYDGALELPRGNFGLGGAASAPTYFDDIEIFPIGVPRR